MSGSCWKAGTLVATLALIVVPSSAEAEPPLAWMNDILAAWEQTCRAELGIAPDPLPWIVFYDTAHAWHVKPERALRPAGHQLKQSVQFAGRRYPLYEVRNRGKLQVPGRNPISLAPAAVAMPYSGDRKAFFILTTPQHMLEAHRDIDASAAGDLASFFAGLAMHELAHTRQLPWMMPELNAIQKRHNFPASIDDNLIENTFRAAPEYKQMFDQAQHRLTDAIQAPDDTTARLHTRKALNIIRGWQKRFYTGDYEGWNEIEEEFLALEGAAMWVQFRHAVRVAPPNQPAMQTLVNLAQRTDSWSQSLGLGLFLLIDRFDPGWRRRFFSDGPPPSPVAVLEAAVREP